LAGVTNGVGDESARSGDHRFPTAFRGYEASAVDTYIEALESRLAEADEEARARIDLLESELEATRARLVAREAAPADLSAAEAQRLEAMSQSIVEVLRGAHDEAAAVRERARAEAQTLLRQAEARLADADRRARDAASMRERAQSEVQAIIRQAEAQVLLRQAEARRATKDDAHDPPAGPSTEEPSEDELTTEVPAPSVEPTP